MIMIIIYIEDLGSGNNDNNIIIINNRLDCLKGKGNNFTIIIINIPYFGIATAH